MHNVTIHKNFARDLDVQSSIVCNSKIRVYPHITRTILSSASLFVNYLRNWHIRNFESNSFFLNRQIMSLANQKHPLWLAHHKQGHYEERLQNRCDRLNLENAVAKVMGEVDDTFQSNKPDIKSRVTAFLDMKSRIKKSLKVNVSPESEEQLLPRLKGIYIELSGARLGNRSIRLKKMIGSTSTNGVKFTIFDVAQAQIPGKLGTYGIKLKLLYSAYKTLPNHNVQLFDGLRAFRPFG